MTLRSGEPEGGYRAGYLKLKTALHDRTTGLTAVASLVDRLRAELDGRRHVGVLHFEAVDVALVESIYGWQVLDRILERAAEELRRAVGVDLPPGTMLAVDRVAGDGLLALVPARTDGTEVDARHLDELGEAVRERLHSAFSGDEFAGLSPPLVFRAGRALLSLDPFYRFERRVYAALREAATFADQRQQRRELSWGEELQRIIRERAVRTLLQPVVDLASGSVIGFEALSRGPRESLFEMPRAMFAMSGRLGIEAQLDGLCLEEALRTAAAVAVRGKLFVNVLPCAEGDATIDRLRRVVDSGALEPRDLVLEFPERATESGLERFRVTVERVREQGCGVSLDDVGSGSRSREIIERVRPDFVKVDPTLVRGIRHHLLKQELVAQLVRIAGDVGATVVGLGIESEEEADALARAGATHGQGFLFAGPSPPELALRAPRGGDRAATRD